MFNQGEIADLRNLLPASVVEGLMLELVGEPEPGEEKKSILKALKAELAKDNELLAQMVVAEKLGKTLGQLQDLMTVEELGLWLSFYELRADEERKQLEKAKQQSKRRR